MAPDFGAIVVSEYAKQLMNVFRHTQFAYKPIRTACFTK